MRRLRAIDIVVLLLLAPAWLLCFALSLHRVIHDRLAWASVFVSRSANVDDYPIVSGFWLDGGMEQGGLVLGDKLVRVGDADLRGVGPFEFVVRVYESVNEELRFTVSFLRGESAQEAILRLRRIGFPWRLLPLSLGFAVVAVLALLQAPSPRLARTFFLAGMTYSLYWAYCFGGGLRALTYLWAGIFSIASFCMFPFWLRTILLFVEEIAPTGKRLPLWPWLFSVYGLAMTSMAFGTPFSHAVGLQTNFLLNAAFAATMLIVLIINFRRTGAIGRRQLKWVVYGLYLSAVPVFFADAITMAHPSWIRVHELATLSLIFVPLCLLIAIVRFNLFDIDRLMSTTITYSVLLLFLVGGMLVGVPQLALAVSRTFGVEPASGHVAFSLLLAVFLAPGQYFLRPRIERLFFTERYAVEQGVQRLFREVSGAVEVRQLLILIGEQLYNVLRAEHCVVYQRTDTLYAPIFVQGSTAPPALEAHSPLVAALQAKAGGVDDERWRRAVRAQLSAADRALLDALPTTLVLDIGQHEPPAAFVCLGGKSSGDVYTTTDVRLLDAVAEKGTERLLTLAMRDSTFRLNE